MIIYKLSLSKIITAGAAIYNIVKRATRSALGWENYSAKVFAWLQRETWLSLLPPLCVCVITCWVAFRPQPGGFVSQHCGKSIYTLHPPPSQKLCFTSNKHLEEIILQRNEQQKPDKNHARLAVTHPRRETRPPQREHFNFLIILFVAVLITLFLYIFNASQ